MLVLSRKSGEKIHIGEDVVIEIKRVTGSRVTVAIDAPRHIRILRGELLDDSQTPAAAGIAEELTVLPPADQGEETPQEPASTVHGCLMPHPQVGTGDLGPGVLGT